MNVRPKSPGHGRPVTVVVVAVLLLASMFFILWQRQVARQLQAVRWNEGFTKLDAILIPVISLQPLKACAKATVLADDGTPSAWDHFLTASEWRQRYPGMQTIGYLEPMTQANGEPSLYLKFISRRNATTNEPAFDPTTDATIASALNNWYNHSNGLTSAQLTLPFGETGRMSNRFISFFPLTKNNPARQPINQWLASPSGILFFQLDRAEYFHSLHARLADQSIELQLLAPDDPEPPHTPTHRPISIDGSAGLWRFLAILKPAPAGIIFPPWLLLACGLILSGVFFWLFLRQTRLRYQAEESRELVLAREAEILALNRDLEQKIITRTAELNVALAEEKELNRLKTNFTSMVTHEIRTPLEIILSSTDILLRYLDRLQPERRTAHLHGIKSAVHRMNALMADVLLFSRAEAGRMEFHPAALDLGALCHKLVDEIESATNRRCPVRLALNDVSEPARADENLLRHILTNLLSNAIKYSPVGKEVTLTVTRAVGDAIFTVQDSGMGIPDEDRRRIFTPFYRGKNVATIQGTGLGLVIVKHCTEQHGGTIEMENPTDGGTKVTVRLPLFSPAHTEFLKRIGESQEPE